MTATITQPSTQLEDAMLAECREGHRQAVAIADRARELNRFLDQLHGEFPDVPRSEMAEEAKVEPMAQFVDRQLVGALAALSEMTEVEDRVPAQAMTLTRETASALTAAKDALAAWRGNA